MAGYPDRPQLMEAMGASPPLFTTARQLTASGGPLNPGIVRGRPLIYRNFIYPRPVNEGRHHKPEVITRASGTGTVLWNTHPSDPHLDPVHGQDQPPGSDPSPPHPNPATPIKPDKHQHCQPRPRAGYRPTEQPYIRRSVTGDRTCRTAGCLKPLLRPRRPG